MVERFDYCLDQVSTADYCSAIEQIVESTSFVPTEPISLFDLDFGVLKILPELRKIIVVAGEFTSLNDHRQKHYFLRSSGSPRVLLEPFIGANSSHWVRFCIDYNPREDQKRKNRVDFYLPDTEDTGLVKDIQEYILRGESKRHFYIAQGINTEKGQLRAKKFFSRWQEGLRYLLGAIREPVDSSGTLLRSYEGE
jgi:hypothetical protein